MSDSFLALARKYRPKKLTELIGQDIFVSTIQNALSSNRLAHAYLFSGVRGVGKTTAARILAHLFNGENEASGNPIDLQEVDSARYTGVNEMRELLDGIKYRPSNWKYKVYILDEVHMLSNAAVSSLLKNLEEPPEHVKFIFCTTEPRKIPATIISRCQRFDLKRVEFNVLAKYLQNIAKKEGSEVELNAANLIAKASDGSVRDGLSILDKALSSEKKVQEKHIQELLGLVDRSEIYSLFENIIGGKPKEGLIIFNQLYDSGADPLVIIQDLLDVVHWISRVTVTPEVMNEAGISEIDKKFGDKLSKELNVSELSRIWQILLKGYQEVQSHEMPNVISEMLLLRLAYASDLPTTDELAKNFSNLNINQPKTTNGENQTKEQVKHSEIKKEQSESSEKKIKPDTVMEMKNINVVKKEENLSNQKSTIDLKKKENITFASFKEVVNFFLEKKEVLLFNHLFSHVSLVNFQQGKIELNPQTEAPKDLASKVSALLSEWTNKRWVITFSQQEGEITLDEQSKKEKRKLHADLMKEKEIKEILNIFPGATISNIKKEGDKE